MPWLLTNTLHSFSRNAHWHRTSSRRVSRCLPSSSRPHTLAACGTPAIQAATHPPHDLHALLRDTGLARSSVRAAATGAHLEREGNRSDGTVLHTGTSARPHWWERARRTSISATCTSSVRRRLGVPLGTLHRRDRCVERLRGRVRSGSPLPSFNNCSFYFAFYYSSSPSFSSSTSARLTCAVSSGSTAPRF